MRVLHVEDNPIDADLTRRLLQRRASDILLEQVPNLAAARNCLTQPVRFDAALVDLGLPDGSGLALLAEIREQELPLAVVVLTGSGDPDGAISALRGGADDYLAKSHENLERLPATLRGALKRFRETTHRRARPLRVLYAEPHAMDADLTLRYMARCAPYIQVTVVTDAEQALSRIPVAADEPNTFDLLLLDYRLPGVDALEVVKDLRSIRGLDMPIVIVTGQGSEEVAVQAMHLGADDYLFKHSGYLNKLPAIIEKAIRQVELARERNRLRQAAAVLASTREGVVVTDLNSRIVWVNRAFCEITGFGEDELIGNSPSLIRSGRHDDGFYREMWQTILTTGHWQGEIWNRRKNGEVYPQLLTVSTVYDEDHRPSHYAGVMTDISRLKQTEARLEQLAHYDPLTELPNRLLLQSRLDHALAMAERQRHQIAVLFIDLDRFKNVNDSMGHPIGDELLQAIARRLRGRLRAQDTLGRLGGDEFLVVIEKLTQIESAAAVARLMIDLLEQPFVLSGGHEVYIGASVGISIYPADGTSVTELLQHADAAMYQAKEQGRNTYQFYTRAMTETVNQRLNIDARLRRALAQQEFVLHYQPQVAVTTGQVIGCEALVRWNHPERGLLLPADFIAIAEDSGLIVPLGAWVLRTACIQFKQWIDTGVAPKTLAVNLSARQVRQREIVETVAATLRETRMPPNRLTLELTESAIMGRGAEPQALLDRLRALGLRLALDDFGTGYSSLAYLKRFPIDELKIDRSFITGIPDDRNDTEIAASIIAMARNLHIDTIAEGVETSAQLAFLREHGCGSYQGYLYTPPLPAEQFQSRIEG